MFNGLGGGTKTYPSIKESFFSYGLKEKNQTKKNAVWHGCFVDNFTALLPSCDYGMIGEIILLFFLRRLFGHATALTCMVANELEANGPAKQFQRDKLVFLERFLHWVCVVCLTSQDDDMRLSPSVLRVACLLACWAWLAGGVDM